MLGETTPVMMGRTGNTLRWKSSCPVVILAAAILSSCFLLTQAQNISITIKPSQPLKGEDVTLTPGGNPNFLVCSWYRGGEAEPNRIFRYIPSLSEQQNGADFTGWETSGPDCSLHIRNLKLSDTGNYLVSKIASGGTEVGRAHIEVLEMLTKPTVSVFPCPYPVEFTDSVRLTCETRSGDVEVRWLKNSGPLGKSDRISLSGDNRTLSIPSVTRDDAGLYRCEVSDSISAQMSDVTYIAVIYGPETPVIRRTDQEHLELRLTCEADTFPNADYVWFCNGRRCGTGSELLVREVTPEPSGNYVCQAMNVLTLQKRNSSALELEEEVQVRDVTVTGPSVAAEDQPVRLMCTAAGSSVSYSWFKGDQSLEPGYHVVLTNNNQNLTLDPSRRSDSGNYTCRASNSNSSGFSEPHRLDILYGPDPPIIREVFDRDHSWLYISCRADSYPAASYAWFLNEKLLPEDQYPLDRPLSGEYSGNYTCQAENRSTQQKRNTTLELMVRGQWKMVEEEHPNQDYLRDLSRGPDLAHV